MFHRVQARRGNAPMFISTMSFSTCAKTNIKDARDSQGRRRKHRRPRISGPGHNRCPPPPPPRRANRSPLSATGWTKQRPSIFGSGPCLQMHAACLNQLSWIWAAASKGSEHTRQRGAQHLISGLYACSVPVLSSWMIQYLPSIGQELQKAKYTHRLVRKSL